MAERSQVTVLFTDLVGFTAFSEKAGEEAAFRLMQEVTKVTGDIVRKHGGAVQALTGDGVMAVFGAPVAHEDSPLRACRTALEILDRIETTKEDFKSRFGVSPQLRIGVNSGAAIVGAVADGGATSMGDTVNIAARLQTVAEPGTVYMSEATNALAVGLIVAEPKGRRQLKGRAEPIDVYRLVGLRDGASSFVGRLQRGLSPFVGRERELDHLERSLDAARPELRVIDIVAEPGMGKSRLLHEFRARLAKAAVFILLGHCTPDAQATPFQPFIEVARNALSLNLGEAPGDIARKIEMGLATFGKMSDENAALMLNLFGLSLRPGALAGLDGLLIGERTRALLLGLLEARCRATPTALVIEDLHWADGASEALIGDIVDAPARFPLLVLLSRRPEHQPAWLGEPHVSRLVLEPLPATLVRRLIGVRLKIAELPEALARVMTERAGGNALFAEEIASYLIERGVVTSGTGKVEYDPSAVATALPMSLQSLLAARVGRLAPESRAVLQAASVLGRRFDTTLLAATIGAGSEVDAALAEASIHDLAYPCGSTAEFEFKHALVRDALYQSLLTEPRRELHLRVAEELERRYDNRLNEAAEALAHHYGQTQRRDKAFTYAAMAGAKSLRVYSFDEAERWFDAAFSILAAHPDRAGDRQVAAVLADYVLFLNASFVPHKVTEIVERFRARLDCAGDCQSAVVILHHYAEALAFVGRYEAARGAQNNLDAMADRLADTPSAAYALTSSLFLSISLTPEPAAIFETKAARAIAAAAEVDDPYLQYMVRLSVGLSLSARGHPARAAAIAEDLLAVGKAIGDGRSIAYGMALKAMVALIGENGTAALKFTENGIAMARTASDRTLSRVFHLFACSALSRPEGLALTLEFRAEAEANGWGQFLDFSDVPYAMGLLTNGAVGAGIGWLEHTIVRRADKGMAISANQARMVLAEVYLRMISGVEKPSLKVILRNLPAIVRARHAAGARIRSLMTAVRETPHVDPEGVTFGHTELLLGLLCKARKQREESFQHLVEAKRLLAPLGSSPLQERTESALRELQ